MTGTVRVASPVAFRVAGLPFDARVSSGEIHLGDDGVARIDLPVTLGTGVLRLAGTVEPSPAFTGEERRIALASRAASSTRTLLALVAPRLIASARGTARLDARAEGPAAQPGAARARAPGRDHSDAAGAADPADQGLGRRDRRRRSHGHDRPTSMPQRRRRKRRRPRHIGAAADGAATLSYGSLLDPRPTRVVVPVRGRVTAMPVAPAVIDDASFALRADGDLTQRRASAARSPSTRPTSRARRSARRLGLFGAAASRSARPELARDRPGRDRAIARRRGHRRDPGTERPRRRRLPRDRDGGEAEGRGEVRGSGSLQLVLAAAAQDLPVAASSPEPPFVDARHEPAYRLRVHLQTHLSINHCTGSPCFQRDPRLETRRKRLLDDPET